MASNLRDRANDRDHPIVIGRLTLNAPHDQSSRDHAIVTVPSPEEYQTAMTHCGRTSRSSRDRGVIEPRSRRNRMPLDAESPLHEPTLTGEDLRP